VSIGEEFQRLHTPRCLRLLRERGGFRGEIVVLADVDHLPDLPDDVRVIQVVETVKRFLGRDQLSVINTRNLKTELINHLDVEAYDVCLYLDSDVLVTQDVNALLSAVIDQQRLCVQDNHPWTIGPHDETRGARILSAAEQRRCRNLSVCSGIVACPGGRFAGGFLRSWNDLCRIHRLALRDQGNLCKVIIEQYLDRLAYIPGAEWDYRCDPGSRFVHCLGKDPERVLSHLGTTASGAGHGKPD